MTTTELRNAALDIFQHALRSVDARAATRHAVSLQDSILRVGDSEFDVANRPVYVVGIGKAALSMAVGLIDRVGTKIARAVISTGPSSLISSLPPTHAVFYGGHPFPNQQSLDAAQAAFELLDRANLERAVVIFLISGGGSAMMESPISNDITLEDLQRTNRQLITCGASINEINVVRRSISAVKGGRLAGRLTEAGLVTLIVSDTNSGDESSVASGPTLPTADDQSKPLEITDRYSLSALLPESVVSAIRNYNANTNIKPHPFYILLDNNMAVRATAERARELSFNTTIAFDINEQPVDEGVNLLLTRALGMEQPGCLISGGEFSCRVSGDGRGGRNLETVLRCAIKLHEDAQKSTVVLSAGTDGIDGSSFAAGAIADETTIPRAHELGLDPVEFLQDSNSHVFFENLDDLIVTGPTGTNVRDIRIVLTG